MQYSYNRSDPPGGEANPDEAPAEATTDPTTEADAPLLPTIRDELRSLDRRVVVQWRLAGLIRGLVTGALVGAVIAFLFEQGIDGLWPGLAVFAATAIFSFLWSPLRFRRWGYRVRDADVFVRYGVLWRVTSVIPHRRLQHVDTERGPLERWLGLARIVIYTAGNRGAQTTIPGLAREDAESLRDLLGRLGQGDDAV